MNLIHGYLAILEELGARLKSAEARGDGGYIHGLRTQIAKTYSLLAELSK